MSDIKDNKKKLEVKPFEEVLKDYETMQEKLDMNLKEEIEKEKLIINNNLNVVSHTITSAEIKNDIDKTSSTYQEEGILNGNQISNYLMVDYILNKEQKVEINNIQRYLFMLFNNAIDKQMEKMNTYSKEEILDFKKNLLKQVKYIGIGYDKENNECYYLHEGPDLTKTNKSRIYKYNFPYSIKIKDKDDEIVSEYTEFNKTGIKAESYEELDEGIQNIINLTSIHTLEDAFVPDKDMAYKINYIESPDANKIKYFIAIPFIIIILCLVYAITR